MSKVQDEVAVTEKVKLKEPQLYNVIIHDNPITSFEEVIFIVSRCFDKTEQQAHAIATTVNETKKGICGTYSKEIADHKLDTVDMAKQYLMANYPTRISAIQALKFTLEEA